MPPRSYSGSNFAYQFGPGPATPAIKVIIAANVVMFFAQAVFPVIDARLSLTPRDVLEGLAVWQPFTYMFLHGGIFHILFNMLGVWMFGVELERMWGTQFFARYYIVSGLGGAAAQILLGFMPGTWGDYFYSVSTIGASGALFGILLAYALYFPTREILMSFLFPVQAKYFVMIMGGISLYSAMTGAGGGVAHAAHLGGLAAGWLYLRGRRIRLASEMRYQFSRWRINRARKRFDVHPGGRPPRNSDHRFH